MEAVDCDDVDGDGAKGDDDHETGDYNSDIDKMMW